MADGEGASGAAEGKPAESDSKDTKDEPAEGAKETPDRPELSGEVKRLESALADERKRREATQKELDEHKKAAMSDQERLVAEAKEEGRQEALHEVATELLQAEVRAQGAAKLADPADAVRLLDLDGLLRNDGKIDQAAIGKALDELVKAKPYLAKTNGGPPPKAPQGARDGAKPSEGDDFIRGLAKGLRGT